LSGVEPFGAVDFKQGDVTWISPTLNQIHQLKNLEKNTQACITIQCYMYDESDTVHYDYFDYLESGNKIQQYDPDLIWIL
jgi:phenylalanyl-tRNA synthetase alpha subunit